MNAEQKGLYFFHWGEVRKHYLAKGIDAKQVDAKRHELHKKALGRDKSSKAFTNADLDKVIAAFRAVYDGGNLDAQLEQIEQPNNRAAMAVRRIEVLKDHLNVGDRSTAYVQGMARKLFGESQWHQLDDVQLAQLEGVIVRRLLQLHDKERVEQIRNDAAEHAARIAAVVAPSTGGPF